MNFENVYKILDNKFKNCEAFTEEEVACACALIPVYCTEKDNMLVNALNVLEIDKPNAGIYYWNKMVEIVKILENNGISICSEIFRVLSGDLFGLYCQALYKLENALNNKVQSNESNFWERVRKYFSKGDKQMIDSTNEGIKEYIELCRRIEKYDLKKSVVNCLLEDENTTNNTSIIEQLRKLGVPETEILGYVEAQKNINGENDYKKSLKTYVKPTARIIDNAEELKKYKNNEYTIGEK